MCVERGWGGDGGGVGIIMCIVFMCVLRGDGGGVAGCRHNYVHMHVGV